MSASMVPVTTAPVTTAAAPHQGFFAGLASHFHGHAQPAPVAQPGSAIAPAPVQYVGSASMAQPMAQPMHYGGSAVAPVVTAQHVGSAVAPQHHGFFGGIASHFHHPQQPSPRMMAAGTSAYANVAASVAQQEGVVSPVLPGGVMPTNIRPMPGSQPTEIGKTVYPPQRLAHEEHKEASYVGEHGQNVHLIVNQTNFQSTHHIPESDFHHVAKFIPQGDLESAGVHNMKGGHPGGHFGPNLPVAASGHVPNPALAGQHGGIHLPHMPFGHHGAQPAAAPTYGAPAVPTYGAAYGGSAMQAHGCSAMQSYGGSAMQPYGGAAMQPYGGSAMQAYGGAAVQAHGGTAMQAHGGSASMGAPVVTQPYGGSASMPQPSGGSASMGAPVYGQ